MASRSYNNAEQLIREHVERIGHTLETLGIVCVIMLTLVQLLTVLAPLRHAADKLEGRFTRVFTATHDGIRR